MNTWNEVYHVFISMWNFDEICHDLNMGVKPTLNKVCYTQWPYHYFNIKKILYDKLIISRGGDHFNVHHHVVVKKNCYDLFFFIFTRYIGYEEKEISHKIMTCFRSISKFLKKFYQTKPIGKCLNMIFNFFQI